MASRLYDSVDTADTTIEESAIVVVDDDEADHNIEALIGDNDQHKHKQQKDISAEIVRDQGSESRHDWDDDDKGKVTAFQVTRQSKNVKKKI